MCYRSLFAFKVCGQEIRAGRCVSITAVIADRAGALHLGIGLFIFLQYIILEEMCKCVIRLDWRAIELDDKNTVSNSCYFVIAILFELIF